MAKFFGNINGGAFKSTILYFGATILSFLISIFTYPLFAKYMNVSEFAAFNYFNNYSGFFTFFFSFNLYMYFSATFFRVEERDREKLLQSLMTLILFWNLFAFTIVSIISYYFLNNILHIKFNVSEYLFFAVFSASISSLKTIYMVKLRLTKQPLRYFIITAISKVCSIGIGLLLVIKVNSSAQSRFLGVIAAEFIISVFVYSSVFKHGGFKLPMKDFKKILHFVWPLLISSIVYYPLIGMDQMFLEQHVDTKTLGLYSIGLNFAMYLHTFNFSVYQTIEPDIIKARVTNNFKQLKKYIIQLASIGAATTLVYCFLSKYVIGIMSRGKFTDAYPLSNILSVSYFFVLLFSVGDSMLTASGNGKKVLLVNGIGCLATMLILSVTVKYGAVAVAISRVLSFMIITAISFFFAFQNNKTEKNESALVF